MELDVEPSPGSQRPNTAYLSSAYRIELPST
jgi:hypothetical protein